MALPRLALAVIGDEIGPSLPEMISFCAENRVTRLDMRTVDGRNLLGMTIGEVKAIRATLDRANLAVPTFVSPLLKWPGSLNSTRFRDQNPKCKIETHSSFQPVQASFWSVAMNLDQTRPVRPLHAVQPPVPLRESLQRL